MQIMSDSNIDIKNTKIIKTIKIELSKEEYDHVGAGRSRPYFVGSI